MHMLKPVIAFACRLPGADDFERLSLGERRAAWSFAVLTHLLLLPVTYALVKYAPALRPTLGTHLFMHFLMVLLSVKVAVLTSYLWVFVQDEEPPFKRNGWFFAFGATLWPLLLASCLVWLSL